jgi:hypothetical protein
VVQIPICFKDAHSKERKESVISEKKKEEQEEEKS